MDKNPTKYILRIALYFVLSLIIFLVSFPVFEPDFSTGMDASFSWGINYLFHNDFEALKDVYCTYGPLGFIKKPVALASNFGIALAVYSALKLTIIILLLVQFFDFKRWYNFIFITLASLLFNLDTLFIFIVAQCFWLFLKQKQWGYFLLASFLSIIALYIKPSFGFACFGIGIMFGGISLYQKYEIKKLAALFVGFLIVVGLSSLLIMGDVFYWIKFLSNTLFITSGYSSSLSLFPENNWLTVSIFIMSISAIPVLIKNKGFRMMFLLLIIPMFIAWKYAMVRQDYSHYKYLIDFTLLFGTVLLLFACKKEKIVVGALTIVATLCLIINAKNIEGYGGSYNLKMNGITNIKPWVFSFKSAENSFKEISSTKTKKKELPIMFLKEIGNNTIDVFPWELTYVAENQLKWKPRKALMSLHMSGHHELMAAKDLNMENGPDYILFHWKKDSMGGHFGSIDYRHLFNDSPNTIYNLLNDYKLKIYDKKVGVFKKRKSKVLKEPVVIKEEIVKYSEWISVPESKNELIRLQVECGYNFLGKLKSTSYKGEAFYIDYELITGEVRKYRFIPSIAENGLWISPLIKHIDDDITMAQVKRVRFTSSNDNVVSDNITIRWEKIDFMNSNTTFKTIFSGAKKI